MRFLLCFALLSLVSIANAQETPTSPPQPETAPELKPPGSTDQPPISESTPIEIPSGPPRVGVGYTGALLGYPIPTKHGASIAWNFNPKWRVELSYLSGDFGLSSSFIDLASVKETLISLQSRHFIGQSSFNWLWGIGQQTYDARLGSDLISSASGAQTDYGVFMVKTLGAQFGLGNSWQPKRWLRIGIDYLIVNIPFRAQETNVPAAGDVQDEEARRTIEDTINIAKKVPTAVLGRFSLAVSF